MSLYVGNSNFCGVLATIVIIGGGLITSSKIILPSRKPAVCRPVFAAGIFLVVVAVGLLIAAVVVTNWSIVAFASPEGTQIQTRVETSWRLPSAGDRVIVNPEPVGELVTQWDALPVEEKQKSLDKILADPRTRVWYKPAGSDEFESSNWKDLLEDDKKIILASIPELTPIYEF